MRALVSVTTDPAGKVTARTPKCPSFIEGARRLGGKWRDSDRAWVFPGPAVERVRALCREVYGEDGSPVAERVGVRVRYLDGLKLSTSTTAHRFGRQLHPRMAESVALVEGSPGEPGPVVYEVYGVPRDFAERVVAEKPEYHEVFALPEPPPASTRQPPGVDARLTPLQRVLRTVPELSDTELAQVASVVLTRMRELPEVHSSDVVVNDFGRFGLLETD